MIRRAFISINELWVLRNMGTEIGDMKLYNNQSINDKWFYAIEDARSVQLVVKRRVSCGTKSAIQAFTTKIKCSAKAESTNREDPCRFLNEWEIIIAAKQAYNEEDPRMLKGVWHVISHIMCAALRRRYDNGFPCLTTGPKEHKWGGPLSWLLASVAFLDEWKYI